MEREQWRMWLVAICGILQIIGFVCFVSAVYVDIGGNPTNAIILWSITVVGGIASMVRASFSEEDILWRAFAEFITAFIGIAIVFFSVEKIFSLL